MDTAASGKYPARFGYGSQNLVWIREIDNPNKAFHYRGHQSDVHCVRFSPGAGIRDSGWVASGDAKGNLKTWTCRADDPATKLELSMGKYIRDAAWIQDLKKVLVVGEGKTVSDCGKLADAVRGGGNQFGFTEGLIKQVNSCDFTRAKIFGNKTPNYAVACDQQGTLCVYMLKSGKIARKAPKFTDQSMFVAVRIRPDDFYFAALGKKRVKGKFVQNLFVYKFNDYKTETQCVAHLENCHDGTVTGLAWNDDGSQLVTCAMDKTVRVWNFTVNEDETCSLTPSTVITIGKELVDMQCSVVWRENTIISCSVSGELNFCDPTKDVPVVQHAGHSGSVDDIALGAGDECRVFSVSQDRLVDSNMTTGASRKYKGDGHGKGKAYKFVGVSCDGKEVVTGGNNDTVLWHDTSGVASADEKSAYKTGGAIKFFCCSKKDPSLVVIGCSRTGLTVIKDKKCVAQVLPDKNELSVKGGDLAADDSKVLLCGMKGEIPVVYVYALGEDGSLTLLREQVRGNRQIYWVKFHPDSKHYYASTQVDYQCAFYDSESDSKKTASRDSLNLHSGAVNDVAFTPSGGLYTVGSDGDVYYFSVPFEDNNKHIRMQNAHEKSVTKVIAVDDNVFITCSDDGAIKKWRRA